MIHSNYILRFDDACPTMNLEKWNKIEKICDTYNIKPIVAAIPNNKDLMLNCSPEDSHFWLKVKRWQDKGWHIALHGYDHVYVNKESGLVPFNNDSEFAELDYEKQKEKIQKGLEIFSSHNIQTKIWIAPSHSFDRTTLEVLKDTPIEIISDGIALTPFLKYKFKWIPQQIWRFREMPFGTWTGCFHPNTMSEEDMKNLEKFIEKNHDYFVDIDKLKYRRFCILNKIFEILFWSLWKIKKIRGNSNENNK